MRLKVMLEQSAAICNRITHRVDETCLRKVFDEVPRQLIICQGLRVNDRRDEGSSDADPAPRDCSSV